MPGLISLLEPGATAGGVQKEILRLIGYHIRRNGDLALRFSACIAYTPGAATFTSPTIAATRSFSVIALTSATTRLALLQSLCTMFLE